jgi:Rhodopirellula transposase DDE domain
MDDVLDSLIISAAKRLFGSERRSYMAEVALEVCQGSPRVAERRFGWGRQAVQKGIHESKHGIAPVLEPSNRGRRCSEVDNPQLAVDIRLIVEPFTQADPELKTARQYTNLSAAEVRQALLDKGYSSEQLPAERTLRDILNRMNYRLKRIQKGKPLKKTPDTDAIFDNVHAVHAEMQDDPETLEISVDTKTKVKLGEYSLGGKKPDRLRR